MSKGVHFQTRMLQMAQDWRSGAGELRQQFRQDDRVPFSVEVGASALEVCAERIESEVRAHYEDQRQEEANPS